MKENTYNAFWIICFVFFLTISSVVNADDTQHRTTSNYLEIQKVITTEYPKITIYFNGLFHGSPLKAWNQNFYQNVLLLEDGKVCQIVSAQTEPEAPRPELNVIVLHQGLKPEDLNKLQILISELSADYELHFWANQYQELLEVPFKNLYNKIFFEEKGTNLLANLNDFFNKKFKESYQTEKVYLFIGNLKKIKEYQPLSILLKNMRTIPGHWYAILYKDISNKFPDMKDPDVMERCLFLYPLEKKDAGQTMRECLQLLKDGYSSISFNVSTINPLQQKRTYQLLIPVSNDTLKKNFTVTFKPDLLLKYYTSTVLQKADNLDKEGNFPAALDTLLKANYLLKQPEFRQRASLIFQHWADSIQKKSDFTEVPQWRTLAEHYWKFNKNNAQWFADLKLNLLKQYLKEQEEKNASLMEKLETCKEILALNPDLNEYQIKFLNLNGAKAETEGKLWEAAKFYETGWKKFSLRSFRVNLTRVVKSATKQAFNQHHFALVFQNGLPYLPYFSNDFAFRYYLAYSANKIGRFSEAEENFEWLLNHWQKGQKLVSWDEAFETLQQIYLTSLRFDKAFDLIQRIYRDRPEEAGRLKLALLNLRAKYLFPWIDIYPVFYQRVGPGVLLKNLFPGSQTQKWPAYLVGIMRLDHQGRPLEKIGKTNLLETPGYSQLKRLAQLPALISSGGKMYLINRLPNGYILMQLTQEENNEEKVLLRNIQQDRMNDQPWLELYNYALQQGLPLLSELLAVTIGQDWLNGNNQPLSGYWQKLKKNRFIRYLVLHNQKGEIVQSVHFSRNLLDMSPDNWQRSSKALALFRQDVQYQQQNILDICYPIYSPSGWQGSLRIGYLNE